MFLNGDLNLTASDNPEPVNLSHKYSKTFLYNQE